MPCSRIALTPGEPAGIGPDICLQLMQRSLPCELVLVADGELLSQRADALGLEFRASPFEPSSPAETGAVRILQVDGGVPSTPGKLSTTTAAYVIETLCIATAFCRAGDMDALVTGPVHKSVINDAGIPFSGHTELLAEISQADDVLMLLAANQLRVALATTHMPLSSVPSAITPSLLTGKLRLLVAGLQEHFGIPSPRILVCGLNPHAGESGYLGHEDSDIIAPVIEALAAEGLNIEGPLPADSLFVPAKLEKADAVLAMYHDQGLPVLKHLGFGRAVNITLGLPFIRTSVDHGTALDLAGRGTADAGSLRAALDTALHMLAARIP
ncbi:MAG: 4-hydroxythreonine-4-phosphate dehydrogenase PdxA [Gammaproteobacteria bacterium]|nr:MAG: 4-hydroxythreonine-4-phosphate dehydrogenase PdxA [Gammaproteobacteria bacterium]